MPGLLRISDAASLGLHAMTCLAGRRGGPARTAEIASTLGCSHAHLAKVFQRLAKAGLVRSERGPRGGFGLARPAEQITLGDVYEAIEGPLRPTDCLLARPVCGSRGCLLGDLLKSVNRQVDEYLRATTLADLGHLWAEPRGAETFAETL